MWGCHRWLGRGRFLAALMLAILEMSGPVWAIDARGLGVAEPGQGTLTAVEAGKQMPLPDRDSPDRIGPVSQERHLRLAMFLGCEGDPGGRVCRIAEGEMTLRIPLDSALPQPFASFLVELAPLTPVSVIVDMPARGSTMPPRLISIRKRDEVLADRVWPHIQGDWQFDGYRKVNLTLTGRDLTGTGGQWLLGGDKLWLSHSCDGPAKYALYLTAYGSDNPVCYRVDAVGPGQLKLVHLPLGDRLEFHRPH